MQELEAGGGSGDDDVEFQKFISQRDIWQGRYLAKETFLGSIDLASWFLEVGEAESAEDEEGGEEGEEDEAGEEAVGGEEERVDEALGWKI